MEPDYRIIMPLNRNDLEALIPLARGGENNIDMGFEKKTQRAIIVRSSRLGGEHLSREMQFQASWNVQGFLPFYGYGEDGGLWTLHPYVHGLDLSQAPAFEIQQALDLGLQLARALDKLHQRGYVHGDLHPGNLLLSHQAELFVLDLHCSQLQDKQAVRTQYSSPEHWKGSIGPASDLFAFGLCLWRFCTGSDPLPPVPMAELSSHWAKCEPQGIDTQISALITSCIQVDPQDRPESASEIVEALELLIKQYPKSDWEQWAELVDQAYGSRLLQASLSKEAAKQHCFYWMNLRPASKVPEQILSEILAREEALQPQTLPADPLKKAILRFLAYKLAFLALVGLLLLLVWPKSKDSGMDTLSQRALSQKMTLQQSDYQWIALDSSCKHWTYEGQERSDKLLLARGSHQLSCQRSGTMENWQVQISAKGKISWQKMNSN